MTTREEINPDGDVDFPGRTALRARITSAREAGDLNLLRSLQQQHREMRLAFTAPSARGKAGASSSRSVTPTVGTSVLRTPTSAESTVPSLKRREICGWLVTWGEGLASNDLGEVIMLDVQPADVRAWLSEVDPATIPVKADHVTSPVGRWHRFALSSYGLMSVASIERCPAGDLLLDAAAEGAGLSFAADISRCYKTHRVRNGLSVYAGGPIRIIEGSVCPEPADERCVVTLVRGAQPAWMSRMDALRRHELLRNLRPVAQLVR